MSIIKSAAAKTYRNRDKLQRNIRDSDIDGVEDAERHERHIVPGRCSCRDLHRSGKLLWILQEKVNAHSIPVPVEHIHQ